MSDTAKPAPVSTMLLIASSSHHDRIIERMRILLGAITPTGLPHIRVSHRPLVKLNDTSFTALDRAKWDILFGNMEECANVGSTSSIHTNRLSTNNSQSHFSMPSNDKSTEPTVFTWRPSHPKLKHDVHTSIRKRIQHHLFCKRFRRQGHTG